MAALSVEGPALERGQGGGQAPLRGSEGKKAIVACLSLSEIVSLLHC